MKQSVHNAVLRLEFATAFFLAVMALPQIGIAQGQLEAHLLPNNTYDTYAGKDYFAVMEGSVDLIGLLKNVQRNHLSNSNFGRDFTSGANYYGIDDLRYALWVFPNHPIALELLETVVGNAGEAAMRKPLRPASFRRSTSWPPCAPTCRIRDSSWSGITELFPMRARFRLALPQPDYSRCARTIPTAAPSSRAAAGARGPG